MIDETAGKHFFRSDRRGHMLLVAIVLASVMAVFLGMAVQPLRTRSLRMKERQMIYRGNHIADGIRRFYFKHKRFPFELEELVESEPRFIRRLYDDPMSPNGEWDLVYLNPLDRSAVNQLALPSSLKDMAENLEREPQQRRPRSQLERRTEQPPQTPSAFTIKTRQITGIRSKSDQTGLKVYQDSRIYSDWLFTALPRKDLSPTDALKKRTRGLSPSPFQ